MPRSKTLIGAYTEDAQYILDSRKEKVNPGKGKRKRENTADVVERLVQRDKGEKAP